MCGIAGWIDWKNDLRGARPVAEAMQETLRERGPDEGGLYGEECLWLIHRRLAVVDVENGKQPMHLDMGRGRYHMVYNGELYNVPALREELEALGHVFRERSDTEVLLHAHIEWGEGAPARLNGIFAYAVWEERSQSLFLARDRMGVKPLFFHESGDGLLFGSQIGTLLAHPALKAELDGDGLRELFFMGPGRTPGQGVLRGVRELEPGQCAHFDRDGLRVRSYWRLEAREHGDDLAASVERVRELVSDAVQRQLVIDVPLCCFLSGGLDSSIISTIAAKQYAARGETLGTYSVDYRDNAQFFQKSVFQPDADNVYIERMRRAIGSDHREVLLDNADLAAALPDATAARDLPGMADIDSSLLLFCREVKRDYTVAVSGECADEIFGGYPWYHNREILFEECFPWARSLAVRRSILKPGAVPGGEEYVQQRYRDTVRAADPLPGEAPLERRMREMSKLNLRWFMQTLLDRKDRMSMACGLEVRVPFCDHRIVEYAYNMPWSIKSHEGREKGILRMAVDGMLPDEIVWRKKSPYPKTHNPEFLRLVVEGVRAIRADRGSLLHEWVDWDGVEAIIAHPDRLESPWYGQLMGAPQVLAYLIQLDDWLRRYGVTPV